MTATAVMIPATDARLAWRGAVSVQQDPAGWVLPWRLPHTRQEFFHDDVLLGCARMPAGVRLVFATDADGFTCHTEPLAGEGTCDLYADGRFIATVAFAEGAREIVCTGLPGGMKMVELWLPILVPFCLRHIALPAGALLCSADDARPKWVTYGSSITHGTTAGSPSFTWPAVVARTLGFNLTSLGFGGQCHADPMVARVIRDLPADFLSINLGINIHGHNSLTARTFYPAVVGAIATIRDGHPTTPFVVGSPIICPARETTPNAAGLTLVKMREEVQRAVETFQRHGDNHIYYLDGLLFGPGVARLLPDALHPTPEGYVLMAEHFIAQVFRRMGVKVPGLPATVSHE